MKWIGSLIFSYLTYAAALFATDFLIEDFVFSGSVEEFAVMAVFFTVMQLLLKPVLKLLFGPLILLTLGVFIVVMNSLLLFFLDFFSNALRIQGIFTLFFATIAVSVFVFVIEFAGRSKFKE